jgi:hypothetical protein
MAKLEGKMLSVRISATMAEALVKRELETDIPTSRLVRRLISMELESVRELKYEQKMETRSKPTMESYYRPPALLITEKAKE